MVALRRRLPGLVKVWGQTCCAAGWASWSQNEPLPDLRLRSLLALPTGDPAGPLSCRNGKGGGTYAQWQVQTSQPLPGTSANRVALPLRPPVLLAWSQNSAPGLVSKLFGAAEQEIVQSHAS